MKTMDDLFKLLIISICSPLLVGCQHSSEHDHAQHGHHHGHNHGDTHAEEFERGPHRGRLLSAGGFALELQIFEAGVPPHYRIYAYDNGEPIPPNDFSASVLLKRLGGRVDEFTFKPTADFLFSEAEVEEPYSFDVEVSAEYKSKRHSWLFASYEGRTEIPDEIAQLSGIKTEKASSRKIKATLRTRGKVLPSEHKIAHVIPRFSGLVREGKKHIGDKVEKGEVLAIIESNESLQPFEVRSQISGTIVNGHLIVGEFVPENQWVYIVADLSEVWVDFFVPLRERLMLKNGQKVLISSISGDEVKEGVITYLAPYADEKSQSQLVRAVISNDNNQLLPGMFVTGDLVIDDAEARVAVRKDAIQTFKGWKVVFLKAGSTYEIRPLSLGKSDGEWIEVLEGLSQGDEYVTENAFLIKADILKAGASHEH